MAGIPTPRMGGRRGGDDHGIFEPNMTPLIDVSLVLVVILMVATPMAFQSSIAVKHAASSGTVAATAARADRIELDVEPDHTLRINRFTVPREALRQTLQPMLQASATRLIVVRCDDAVTHGEFVSVLDECKALGASQIAVVGR